MARRTSKRPKATPTAQEIELGGERLLVGEGLCFLVFLLGLLLLTLGPAGAEALGDRPAVLLADAVELKAALVDLGLDLCELGFDCSNVLRPGGGAVGERGALDLEERRQGEGVGGLGAGVEGALQRPGAAG